jgi:hypothetical protein
MIADDEFAIVAKKVVTGTRKAMFSHMVQEGVDKEEILYAMEEMLTNGHNVANFGINKTFLFTKSDLKA